MTVTAPAAPATNPILSDIELFANIALSLAHNTVLVQDLRAFLTAVEPLLAKIP